MAGDAQWDKVVLHCPFDNAADFVDDNTVLLMHMEGANASTAFVDHSYSQKAITAAGNAQISTGQYKFGTSAAYFDGSGDYLSIADSDDFTFGSGDFTVECFVRFAAYGAQIGSSIFSKFTGTASTSEYWFYAYGTASTLDGFNLGYSDGSTINYLTAWAQSLSLNTWYHVALVRRGSTITLYLNGASLGDRTWAGSFTNTATAVQVGVMAGGHYLNGYIDELRVIKGYAAYTANFTPPTAPYANPTKALDYSPTKKHLTAYGNAAISTAQSKWGVASAYFDGTGDYLTLSAGSDFDFGTAGDFTVEAFVYIAANSSLDASNRRYAHILSIDNGTAESFSFYVTGDASTTGTGLGLWNGTNSASATVTVSQSAWHHIAVTRYAGNLRFFLDGAQVGSTTAFAYQLGNSAHPPKVGGRAWSTNYYYYLNGYIQDLKIYKGYAKYTANFTPPSTALPKTPQYLSGTAKDSANAYASRAIRAYHRGHGQLLGAAVSDPTTGVWSIPCLTPTDKAVVTELDGTANDPYWSNVALLLQMDGSDLGTTFTDVSPSIVTKPVVRNGDTCTKTAVYKYGTASAYFDGTGDYLTVTSSDFAFGTGDFTIECWAYNTGAAVPNQGVFQLAATALPASHTGAISAAFNFGANSFYLNGTGHQTGAAYSANTWTHIAVSRINGVTRLFVNGTLYRTAADTTNYTGTVLVIGGYYNSSYLWQGYIDDFRVTKGVGRYLTDFAPAQCPAAPVGTPSYDPCVVDYQTPV